MPIFGSYPYIFAPNTTIASSQVNADFSAIAAAVNANAAHNGANSDITSLSALTSFSSVTGAISGTFSVGGVATFSADVLMVGTGELKLAAGTTAQRTGSPSVGMIRYNTTTSTFEGYGGVSPGWQPFGIAGGFAQARGLIIKNNAGTPNSLVDVTVSSIQMVNSSIGTSVTRNGVSLTLSTAFVGANGLDTGSVSASTWYYVWVIDNGIASAGLLSLSATTPTLPSGYVYSCRIGAVRTGGASVLLRTLQKGIIGQYTPVAATNTAVYPVMATTSGTISVSNFIPPTATSIRALFIGASPNPDMTFGVNSSQNIWASGGGTGAPPDIRYVIEGVLEGSNVYFTTVNVADTLSCFGWVDNVLAS